MTKYKQWIAIAEVCGWTNIADCGTYGQVPSQYADSMVARYGPCGTKPNGNVNVVSDFIQLPNYHADLNAMHEAEKVLNNEQTAAYYRHLVNLCESQCADKEPSSVYDYHATAQQRAEAFLRAIGKWEKLA